MKPARPLTPHKAIGKARLALRRGNLDEAEAYSRAVLDIDPLNRDCLRFLGMSAFRRGTFDAAEHLFRRVLDLDPNDAQTLTELGSLYQLRGQVAQAERFFLRALAADPDLFGVCLNLGNLYFESGSPVPAMKAYRRALELNPDHAPTHRNLAQLLIANGEAEAAVRHARRAIKLEPGNADGFVHLAAALNRLGKTDEARTAHEKALVLAPDDPSVLIASARFLTEIGDIGAAEAAFRRLQTLDPDPSPALAGLVRIKRATPDDIAAIHRVLAQTDIPTRPAVALHNALGILAEAEGQYAEAYSRFAAANRLVHAGIVRSREDTDRFFETIASGFSADRIAAHRGQGNPDPTPIFIVGMPRSGTSLIEQILSSHRDVAGAGELAFVRDIAADLVARGNSADLGVVFAGLGKDDLAACGRAYVERLRTYSPSLRHITDKLPGNFIYLGLIRLMLPNARIVHCRRDAADCCLSIFKTQFGEGALPYAYDEADLAHYYRHYLALMAHWRTVLGDSYYEISYEALVADQKGETEKLLAYCGLDWDESCLHFHQSTRSVHTASLTQVRQPVYKGSVGIARAYGEAARPLLDALGL